VTRDKSKVKHTLRISEKEELRTTLRPKKDEVTGE
jgi:hypothetical protein